MRLYGGEGQEVRPVDKLKVSTAAGGFAGMVAGALRKRHISPQVCLHSNDQQGGRARISFTEPLPFPFGEVQANCS